MFSKNEILEQLRNGADASDIAQKMADEINAAVHDYEAEKEAAQRMSAKRSDARALVDAMADFFGKYFDDGEMTEDEREQATDAMIELTNSLRELEDSLKGIKLEIKKADRKPNGPKELDDEIIRNFLKSL